MLQTLRDAKTSAPVPFLGIDVRGRVDLAFSRVRLTQRYRNDGEAPIEIVYTFPLPKDAVLLELEAKIGKTRLTAAVELREKASDTYEDAIGAGHAAALVESVGQGLYVANLGNLLPGEAAEIILVYAEANRWENGRLRWRLPTVVAPRFGMSGLEPHQEPETTVDTRYDASFELRLGQHLKNAQVSSSSHTLDVSPGREGAIVRPRKGEIAMDRDIVVDIELDRRASAVRRSTRDNDTVFWASFVPKAEWAEPGARNLKIVLDCSGSMEGDSITAARQALERILEELTPDDRFNLVRFGTAHEVMFPCQVAGTRVNLALAEACARNIAADMGGTNMKEALDAAYGSQAEGQTGGDVIFITDGQAWNEDIVKAADDSGHRIFAIGVGSAVNEHVLRRLSDETGGAAEFVVPGEALRTTIDRQFRRVRTGSITDVEISWPGEPESFTPLPKAVFAGSAIHIAAFYGSRSGAKIDGEAILSFRTASGRKIETAVDLAKAQNGEADDVRLAAARRMEAFVRTGGDSGAREGKSLALAYELLSPWTSLIVVRPGAGAGEAPVLHKVQQMAPAGWAMFAGARRVGGAVLRSTRYFSAEPGGLAEPGINFVRQRAMIVHDRSLRSPTGRFAAQVRNSHVDPHGHSVGAGGFGPAPADLRTGRPAPTNLELKPLAAALEKALVSGGLPETIDGLVHLGLPEEKAISLRRLAATYSEEDVVGAFVAMLFDAWSGEVSMAARVAAQQIASVVDAVLIREVGRIA